MEPVKFNEANANLAPGNNPNTVGLPIAYAYSPTFSGGTPTPSILSCWKPSEEELAEINRTGVVWLSVLGTTTYPVCLMGLNPFTQQDFSIIKINSEDEHTR